MGKDKEQGGRSSQELSRGPRTKAEWTWPECSRWSFSGDPASCQLVPCTDTQARMQRHLCRQAWRQNGYKSPGNKQREGQGCFRWESAHHQAVANISTVSTWRLQASLSLVCVSFSAGIRMLSNMDGAHSSPVDQPSTSLAGMS